MKKNLANIITMTRIIGTLILLGLETLSTPFFICYIWCGFSDILDGFVARKLKISSPLGSRLDTVSDLLFYSIMMFKILPILNKLLPDYIWIAVYTVLVLRALIYLFVFIRDKKLLSRHTVYNKLTGALMFLLPFTLKNQYFFYYAVLVLLVAYAGTIDEAIYIFRHRA